MLEAWGCQWCTNVRLGNVVMLHKHATQSATRTATGNAAATQGAPSSGQEPKASERASSSRSEPTPVPAIPTLVLAVDPSSMVRTMMGHLNQMVDLMLHAHWPHCVGRKVSNYLGGSMT